MWEVGEGFTLFTSSDSLRRTYISLVQENEHGLQNGYEMTKELVRWEGVPRRWFPLWEVVHLLAFV